MKTKTEHAKEEARAQLDGIIKMVEALRKGEEIDGQDPQERIQEDPLSVEVRTGWHNPGEGMENEEYTILLCTGGPACRIIGDLIHDEPDTAKIEYQDWFTPWESYYDTTPEEDEALLSYAQQFYYGR